MNWSLTDHMARIQLFPYFTITSFITRRRIPTQGIRDYLVGPFSRSITFLVLSIIIYGSADDDNHSTDRKPAISIQ